MVRMILRVLIPLCVVNICFTHSLPKSKLQFSYFNVRNILKFQCMICS